MPLRHTLVAVAAATLLGAVRADERDWSLNAADLAAMGRDNAYLAWNPQDPVANNRPGLKLAFFGTAEGCRPGAGALQALTVPQLARARALTGLGLGAPSQAWSPLAGAQCNADTRGELDDSLAALDPELRTGGLGLFTGTGPDPQTGRVGFFAPFNAQGQNGAGANAMIEGSFANIRADWRSPSALRPWSRQAPRPAARIASSQSVAVLQVPRETEPGPTQAKQQLTVGFINDACMASRPPGTARPCQLKFLFTIAIARSGVSDWSQVTWFQGPRVLFDAGQGGIPVIDGPLPPKGRPATLRPEGLVLYESEGAATQHGPFSNQEFAVRIGWDEFTQSLRAIAGARGRKPATRVADAEVAALFGPRWNDAASWVLLSASLGQEVRNPTAARRAAIGGAMHDLQIRDARMR